MIKALRDKSFSTLQNYRIMVYKLIPIRFRPTLFRPFDSNGNEPLTGFCSRYILNKPFISFDDIYENVSRQEIEQIKYVLKSNIMQSQKIKKNAFFFMVQKEVEKLYIYML